MHSGTSQSHQALLPPPTPSIIIFPFHEETDQFDYSHYSPGLSHGKATLQEIKDALVEIQSPLRQIEAHKHMNKGCLIFFLIIMGFNIIGMSIKKFDSEKILFFLAWFLLLAAYSVYKLRLIRGLESECDETLKVLNEDFAARGLKWHKPKNYPKSVELHNEDRSQKSASQSISLSSPNSKVMLQVIDEEAQRQNSQDQKEYAKNGYIPPKTY